MKINRRSFMTLISADEKTLYNVGSKVSIFDISGENIVELKHFDKLRNPSKIAISSDGKLIAYKNTSGHIAIHNIKTGELILKSNGLSEEGNDLFFINDNKQIISSEWNGKIFILDIESGDTAIVSKFSLSNTNILPINDEKIIVFGVDSDNITHIYEISFLKQVTSKELCRTYPYLVESICAAKSSEGVFFYGENTRNNEGEWDSEGYVELMADVNNAKELSELASKEKMLFQNENAEGVVSLFSLTENKVREFFKVPKSEEYTGDLTSEYGYFSSVCISKDERYLLLGLSRTIMVIDLLEKKCIRTVDVEYLSSLHFISFDKKVVIGTWKNIQIIDFQEFLREE